MLPPRFVGCAFPVGLIILGAGSALGQGYPSKPIRIITPGPGAGADFVSRMVAQGISGSLGQQIIVENRPSALTADTVAKAPPDGYTVLLAGTGFSLAPLLQAKTLYDPVRDFAPISWVTSSPNILVVHPSLPVKSVKELIALAKARRAEINYGSSAAATPSHLGAELFKSMAGVDMVRIPYRGAGPALSALIAGEVQIMFSSAGGVTPHIKAGRLRGVAVTSAKPSALFPGLPTVMASGLPGYETTGIYGLYAPAKTPEANIKRLNQEIVRYVNLTDVKEKLLDFGVEAVGSSPEELGAAMKSEIAKMGKVIKDAGIRDD